MHSPRARVALLAITTVFALVTVALGFWQLSRLAQRKARNALVIERLREPALTVATLPHDSASLHYRRVRIDGRYDFAHEIVLTGRTRDGAPGVNIITPVRIAGNDTAVLVNRGWIYAPDALTVDLTKWREPDSISATGYARPLDKPYPGKATLSDRRGIYRWLDTAALHASIPYPLHGYSVVLEGDTASHTHVPPRVPPPPLDEGPHLSYAIQWFSFAAIGIIGTFFFLLRTGREPRDEIDELTR